MSEAMEREGSGRARYPKKTYERELFRLQEELVKMEQWIADTGGRVVAIFEGRDAAGKGGAIGAHHRAHEPAHHPPRGAAEAVGPRAVAVVLPAIRRRAAGGGRDRALRPQLVQPRRRRARARVLHAGRVLPLPAPDPDLRAAARRGRHHPDQVLVLGERRGAGAPIRQAHRRSAAPVEAQRDRPVLAHEVGRLLTGQGRDVRAHRHPRGALARGRCRQQEEGPPQLHRAPAVGGPVRGAAGARDRDAAAAARRGLRAPSARPVHLRARPRRRGARRGANTTISSPAQTTRQLTPGRPGSPRPACGCPSRTAPRPSCRAGPSCCGARGSRRRGDRPRPPRTRGSTPSRPRPKPLVVFASTCGNSRPTTPCSRSSSPRSSAGSRYHSGVRTNG